MLQKKYRLKKYSAFKATYQQRNTSADSYMCVYFGKEKTDINVTTKIAFVVSKKIHKRAVVRNRIKRLMRENFRLLLKEKKIDNIHKYLSVICVARNNAVNAGFAEINESLTALLSCRS